MLYVIGFLAVTVPLCILGIWGIWYVLSYEKYKKEMKRLKAEEEARLLSN